MNIAWWHRFSAHTGKRVHVARNAGAVRIKHGLAGALRHDRRALLHGQRHSGRRPFRPRDADRRHPHGLLEYRGDNGDLLRRQSYSRLQSAPLYPFREHQHTITNRACRGPVQSAAQLSRRF